MSCFHKQVQTGLSAPLLKRKSAGSRDSWEVFLTEKRERDTHTPLVLIFEYGCRIRCDKEAKSVLSTRRQKEGTPIKSPERNLSINGQ